MNMEAHSVTKEHTRRPMAQRIPKSGNRMKEDKRENPSGYQTLPELPPKHSLRGSYFKPWMKTRHNPHSLLASLPPWPMHLPNSALASRCDEQPPSSPAHKLQRYTATTPRRDSPYSHVVSSDMLLARVRILTKMKPEPDDDDDDDDHHHHNLAKAHDQDMKDACDEQMKGRIETWLDGIEDFVPLKSTTPKKYRILVKNER